jgi:hypothetical protein
MENPRSKEQAVAGAVKKKDLSVIENAEGSGTKTAKRK